MLQEIVNKIERAVKDNLYMYIVDIFHCLCHIILIFGSDRSPRRVNVVCASVHPFVPLLKRERSRLSSRESSKEAYRSNISTLKESKQLEGIYLEEEELEPCNVGACSPCCVYVQSLWQNLLWDMAFMLSHNVIIINVYMSPFKGNNMLDISFLRFVIGTKPNCTASPNIDRPSSQ